MAQRKFITPTRFATCQTSSHPFFPVTQEGLALTPTQVKSLTDRGIAVSTQTASYADSETLDNGMFVEPMFRRSVDINDLWNMEQESRTRVIQGIKKDKQTYG